MYMFENFNILAKIFQEMTLCFLRNDIPFRQRLLLLLSIHVPPAPFHSSAKGELSSIIIIRDCDNK